MMISPRAHDRRLESRSALGLLALVLLLTVGCVAFQPVPLGPDSEWRRIERIRLDDLVARPEVEGALLKKPLPKFDYTDGLSADEAAGLAIVMNPELRAFRVERDIAAGQLVGAGILPNPDIEARWIDAADSSAGNWEVSFDFDLTDALLLRGPRQATARLRVGQINWDVAHREWQLAHQVRLAFVDWLFWDEAIRLNDRQQQFAERTRAIIAAKKEHGAATELDVILTEIELAGVERRAKRLQGEQKRALQRLNLLLGLPPDHPTRLQKPEKPLAYAPISESIEELAETLVNRPDLKAAEAGYQIAQHELHLARRAALPHIGIGPSFEHEGDEDSLGVTLSIELPVFNRNQGEIIAGRAKRKRRRLSYAALLHSARAELYIAWSKWQTLDAELKHYFENVAKKMDRSLQLTENAFNAGEVDLLQVLIIQGRVLRSKRELLTKLRDFHHAKLEVQVAAWPTRRFHVKPHQGLKEGRE